MANQNDADTPVRSETIAHWCQVEKMSAATYHKLQRAGLGPKMVKIGGFVRVIEAHSQWRARMTERGQQEAGRREEERRKELARRAGALAARSPLHVSKRRRQIGARMYDNSDRCVSEKSNGTRADHRTSRSS
jgi:hypothetical protein